MPACLRSVGWEDPVGLRLIRASVCPFDLGNIPVSPILLGGRRSRGVGPASTHSGSHPSGSRNHGGPGSLAIAYPSRRSAVGSVTTVGSITVF